MKRKGGKQERRDASPQADLISRAMEVMDPEFLAKTAETNPDFIVGMLGSFEPQALAAAISQRPELFTKMARIMPHETIRRMVDQNRELVQEIVLRVDTDLLMEMMMVLQGE
ncbi:MAG: hypothetical protein AB1384_11430 [Actinomycetota bacterium]